MGKTRNIFVAGMLILLFIVCNASDVMSSPDFATLEGSTWTNPTADTVSAFTPDATATTSPTITIIFNFASGDFLGGTFAINKSGALPFSAVLDGGDLSIVAVASTTSGAAAGYKMHATIMPGFNQHGKWSSSQPATMFIKGFSLLDGTQFEGTLTETVVP